MKEGKKREMRKKSQVRLKERKVNMNKNEITNVGATLVKLMRREHTVGVQRDGGREESELAAPQAVVIVLPASR